MRLDGKIAIITGAAGGMGEAAALLFAAEGAKVAAVDLRAEAVQPVVDKIRADGGTAIAIGADITRAGEVGELAARTVAELGLPTVLFNNAGVDLENKRATIDIDEEAFDKTVEVNLKGTWLMMKYVVPYMIEAGGGSIVNNASAGAFVAVSSAGYCASKAGVVALTRVAATELGRHNIRVNTLNPGMTWTPMAEHQRQEALARGVTEQQMQATMRSMSVLGRMAQPIEMARMALFLASDDSSFATGAAFMNDAGLSIMSALQTGR
ncbi:SDR family oxidoreductase [Actinoplanes sp. NBC_00393]|uniref:SDR family NAD(P)-dependent oxidoreductase n=1 Tax=Actinoplanes sp. NBC_00393 TaxID=2975953 RepID=UPI002E1A38EA